MPRGGKQPGAGRKPGIKNKATLEREHRAIEALQKKSLAPIRMLAKDQLAELVPTVKGIVEGFQRAAMDAGGPGQPGFKMDLWRELRDWIRMYATVADLAADFESPRYRAIAVLDGTGGVGTPFVIRAPAVMANSSEWQLAVGASVIEMEASQPPSGGRAEVLAHPAQPDAAQPPNAPAASPVALRADQSTGRVTIMPPGAPRAIQPSGTQEWLDSIKKTG
jgi:hypothetical protein